MSKSNPAQDVKNHFNFPNEDSTLDTLYLAIKQHIQVFSSLEFKFRFSLFKELIKLEDPDALVEDLMKYADFNADGQVKICFRIKNLISI